MATLTQRIKQSALQLGFTAVGCCAAIAPPGYARFLEWLEAGFAGQMKYLEDRAACYQHPSSVLNGVQSIVMLAMNYRTSEAAPAQPGQGRIARYAWGEADYHDVIHDRLRQLAALVRQWSPGTSVRGVVDTAPLLEREYAQLAGLGWIGKNTLLLSRDGGSLFFLAALLLDAPLDYDQPFATDHCGSCTACLDACPTQAFPQPYVLDATRCISYLTIELRDTIDPELRQSLGDWVFGCDVCQEVCPWNRKAPATDEPQFAPREDSNPLDLLPLFEMDDESFRHRFRNTPLWRARRRGLLRSAAIVLGNQRYRPAVAALARASNDPDPLVREAASWALQQLT